MGESSKGGVHASGALGGVALDAARQDLTITFRGLARSPGFAVVVASTVALAIASNAAVFSLVDAYFLKPLPYEAPGDLVVLWATEGDAREPTTVTPGDYREWRTGTRTLGAVGASNLTFPTLSGEAGTPERVMGALATPDLMRLLRVEPALGRGIRPEDAREGAEPVVVLSHGLWVRRYGADPGVVGRSIRVSGRPTTVIGVMPPDFRHPATFRAGAVRTEVWLPMRDQGDDREQSFLHVVGRVADGSSVAGVRAELDALMERLARAYPGSNGERGALVRSLDDELFGEVRPGLLLLLGAGGLVLLIACANLANLMLARGRRRSRELAVRAALGAGRLRILRQLSVESLVLALAGGAVGVAVVLGLSGPLARAGARYLDVVGDVSVDLRVVAFTLLASVASALLFGVLPALRLSRPDLPAVLGDRSGGVGSWGARKLLVVTEVALTVVLLVTGGLLVRSLLELVRVPTGFEVGNGLVFEVFPTPDRYPGMDDVRRYYGELSDRLSAIPGVAGVTTVSDLPFTTENRTQSIRVPDRPPPGDAARDVEYHQVGPDYFRVMGIPLLEGRGFGDGDGPGAAPVAVVNRTMARTVWQGESPVGRSFQVSVGGEHTTVTVVGVAGDALDDGLDATVEPRLYYPAARSTTRAMAVIVRTEVAPASLVPAVRREAAALDDQVALADLRTLEEHVMLTADRARGAALLVVGFAGLALLIAAVGIYGVLSWAVGERRREMGVRAALGAARERLVTMILRESLGLALLGVAVGALLALAAGRLVSGLLFGVSPLDPAAFAATLVLVGGAATAAAWIPARRAASVSPSEAMRPE